MNNLVKNLNFLKGALSHGQLAKKVGTTQATVSRVLGGDTVASQETVEKFANFFRVTPDVLRNKDLTVDGGAQPLEDAFDTIRIKLLDGFELPRGTQLEQHAIFDYVDVSKSWYRFHLGTLAPEAVRMAIMRDDSMRGEVNIGDVVLVDTGAQKIEQFGEGIYAFNYFGINHIKHAQLVRDGSYKFSGTKAFLDAIAVDGSEIEGLRIIGKVVGKLSYSRL